MKTRQLTSVIPGEEKTYLIAQDEEMMVFACPLDKVTDEQLPVAEVLGKFGDIDSMDVRTEIAERLGLL